MFQVLILSFVGGAFSIGREDNPFNIKWGKGAQAGADYLSQGGWIVAEKKHIYDEVFMQLNPINGKVSGSEAKKVCLSCWFSLYFSFLRKLWPEQYLLDNYDLHFHDFSSDHAVFLLNIFLCEQMLKRKQIRKITPILRP